MAEPQRRDRAVGSSSESFVLFRQRIGVVERHSACDTPLDGGSPGGAVSLPSEARSSS